LTDATCAQILNLKNGYPLPTNGTWEWIGGWALKDMPESNDTEGWSYADDYKDLMAEMGLECYNTPGKQSVNNDIPIRCFRRRTFERQRVLTSYPGVSQITKKMLSMHAQNAKLTRCVSKLNDQVLSMQHKLEQKEAEVYKKTAQLTSQLSLAEHLVEEERATNKELNRNRKTDGDIKSRNSTKSLFLGGKNKKVSVFIDGVMNLKPRGGKNSGDESSREKSKTSLAFLRNIMVTPTSKNSKSADKDNRCSDEETVINCSESSEESLGRVQDL